MTPDDVQLHEVLEKLRSCGKSYSPETLCTHCRIGQSAIYDRSDGKRRLAFWTFYLEFANGVRYFFDFKTWPEDLQRTHKKTLAPPGTRRLLGSPEDFDELIVAEGEADWLTLIDRGFPNAITGGGANNSHALIAEAAKNKRLWIAFDRDAAGSTGTLRIATKAHSVAANVKIVNLPDMGESKKDVSDFFNAYGGNAEGFTKLLADATVFTPPKIGARLKVSEQVVFHHCPKTGRIFDLVVVEGRPLFVRFDPKTEQIDLVDRAGKDGRLRPLDTEAVRAGHVRFSGKPEAYDSVEALIGRVEAFIRRWVTVSPFFSIVSSRYVFLTYIYDRLDTLPYLRVLADRGRGKSRYEMVMGALCFRAANMSGADTASPMFRLIRRYGPTMIIDEGDRRQEHNSDTYSSVTKILNHGIEKSGVVWRTETLGGRLVETAFPVYCPKIISSRERFGDSAVESRCITEIMPPRPKGTYEFGVTPEFEQEARRIRAELMYWRLKTWHRPLLPPRRLSDRVEDRLNQIAAPLVQVMQLLDDSRGVKGLQDHIEEMHQEFLEQRRRSDEGIILETIRACAAEGEDRAYCKRIAERCGITKGPQHQPITPRAVGALLDRVGLKKAPDRKGHFVPLTRDALNPIFEAYGIDVLPVGVST